jgi:hypothetical protein
MTRRLRLTAQFALLGVLALLVFPAQGSAFRGISITLTPSGPSPAILTIGSGTYPIWINQDQVAHTVVFANGLCSFQVAPGAVEGCPDGWGHRPGQYPYTVDSKVQASIVVVALSRAVTLRAKSHRVGHGAQLTLHGQVTAPMLSPPDFRLRAEPVIVLARPDRYHPFRRIRAVMAKGHGTELAWQLRVRPRRRTIYIARAIFEPSDGEYWAPAWSKPFRAAPQR